MLQNGDADGAVTEFQAALRARPRDTGYRANLGAAYLQKTDFDAAIAEFESALKEPRRMPRCITILGLALKLKDKLPEGIAELRKAAELDPQQADANYTLGVTLWQQGELPQAAEALHSAIRVRPDYAEAHYTLGTVLKQQEKFAEAAAELHETIRLLPDLAGAHTTLAAVLRQTGDAEGATAGSAPGRGTGEENYGHAGGSIRDKLRKAFDEHRRRGCGNFAISRGHCFDARVCGCTLPTGTGATKKRTAEESEKELKKAAELEAVPKGISATQDKAPNSWQAVVAYGWRVYVPLAR